MTVFENKIEAYRAYIFDKRKMRTFAGVTEIVACKRHILLISLQKSIFKSALMFKLILLVHYFENMKHVRR